MKKIIKILVWTVFGLIVVSVAGMSLLIYKAKNGFPVSYETESPTIDFPVDQPSVLLFSKSTGWRHGASIDTAKLVFAELADRNGWFLHQTEDGGVFNQEQLAHFDAVIFNNCTGRLLTASQQKSLQDYVMSGGRFIGIHGAGDDSHHWEWYDKNLIGADFSHHPVKNHLQPASVALEKEGNSFWSDDLMPQWQQTDEWYVFFKSPEENGFKIIYAIDGDKIDPDGNILWMKDKGFGMGKTHPVAWYKQVGEGQSFYTSMGHDEKAWRQKGFIQLLEAAIQ